MASNPVNDGIAGFNVCHLALSALVDRRCGVRSLQRRLAAHADRAQDGLDMAGVSITVYLLDSQAKKLWDAPVHTAALRWGA